MAEERLVLTISETCKMLGVSRAHGYMLARTGQLPTLRLGRRLVVPKASLLRMLENASTKNQDGE